jgi:tRNA(fMet)-specific endonuclease VapC
MLRYMLDTDTCIHLMKDRPPKLEERFVRLGPHLCLSSISLAELYFGAEKSSRREKNIEAIESFTASVPAQAFSEGAAARYGQIRVALEKAGRLAGNLDMMIGAHAAAEGLIVVTNNLREFSRMPGVRTETWI